MLYLMARTLAKHVPLVGLLVAFGLLGGCGADSESAEPPTDGSFGSTMERCMRERGWDLVVTDDGGFDARYPSEQRNAFDADLEECMAKFGYDESPTPMTEEEATELYDLYLEAADCLDGRGYPPPEPPSRQAFVEDVISSGLPSWDPYMHLLDATDSYEKIRQLENACPLPE